MRQTSAVEARAERAGTLRSRDCNLLLAHQSLGDFGQCGQDLPADL
ncbi:hypothetical protein [Klebsiella pneumoniae]|nr:hypothetical protein [Klebsiella pneumoniae]